MSATWFQAQHAELARQIRDALRAGRGHRWPLERVVAAQAAILAGDEQWQLHAAEVLR